ncbi:UNVERIFIED_CONTAM: hypothetical protein Sangu_2974500 [Sesamum angustifolium]|uniref:Reverse transcriptase Ty1/copia-type domain-containing protein n=1 Tax=Sesamum angustifolium TaxID=2727405 RepID=A0AAW2IJM7_9LAMI
MLDNSIDDVSSPSQVEINPIAAQDLSVDQLVPQESVSLPRRSARQITRPAASKGWPVHHFDVNNGFLHGKLEEDISMEPPEGYQVPQGHVSKDIFDQLFTIKDLGEAKYFLGLEIARSPKGLIVTQTKYMSDLVSDMGLTQAKTTTTPLPVGIKFTIDSGGTFPDPS